MTRSKWMALLLTTVAAGVILSACGSSSDSSSSTSGSGGDEGGGAAKTDLAPFEKLVEEREAPITKWPAEAPTEPVKEIASDKLIVDITLSAEEPPALLTAEGVVEAAERLGWEGKILYTEFSAAKTVSAFEQAIALGADAVVTQGIVPSQYKSSIKKLHDSGAILVTTYSDFPPSDEYAQAEISENSRGFGEVGGAKAVVEAEGEGQFAIFNFPEYLVLRHQTEATQEKLEECAGCEVLPIIDITSAEAEKTMPTATSTMLQQNPDLTAFFTGIDTFVTNYQMPVVRQQGSEVGIYTYLGGKPTLEAVEKEEINAVVTFPLLWGGWAAVDNIARLFANQKPNTGGLPQRLISTENVGEALQTLGPKGFWDADGFDYQGEYEKLWGLK